MIRIALALLIALPLFASAQPANDPITIEWVPPFEFESGELLDPAGDIEEYRLYCYRPLSNPSRYYAIPGLTNDTVHTATREEVFVTPGTYDCHMTAVSIDGLESERSNLITARWRGRPGPVQILVIQ